MRIGTWFAEVSRSSREFLCLAAVSVTAFFAALGGMGREGLLNFLLVFFVLGLVGGVCVAFDVISNILKEQSRGAAHPSASSRPRTPALLKLLKAFAWFCDKETREHIELIVADLKKDRRTMQQRGHSKSFIAYVLLWKVAGTVVPIMWDGFLRFLNALLPVGKLIAKIKGW